MKQDFQLGKDFGFDFLAATSSSRSDDVTPLVCLSVCHLIFLAVNFAPLHPCTLHLCTFAHLQLCNFATLQLCNFATLQHCNIATLQLCNFATLQLCNFA